MVEKKELPACPVETTLMLISDRWKVLILRDLMPGTKRLGLLSRGTFLGVGKQKDGQRKRAQNAPIERLKPILGVGSIKPLPPLKTRFRA